MAFEIWELAQDEPAGIKKQMLGAKKRMSNSYKNSKKKDIRQNRKIPGIASKTPNYYFCLP